MKRDIGQLTEREYDLVIIGGGIFGACAAWDAVLRGLSVALVECGDFGGAVSANSFKMVHGGIRYLQHLDLERLRASCQERSALLRIAPHLVHPLPILIPTYGHGRKGKPFLGTGMYLYDLLTLTRNNGIKDKTRRIPWSSFLSREEVLGVFPYLADPTLTGGAVFHDGQMYNPPRLVLAFVQSAANAGAAVANYVEATQLLQSNGRVKGIEAKDVLAGESFPIRARAVLNAAGPWAERILGRAHVLTPQQQGVYSRDACFVIPRRLESPYALALQGRTKDPDAVFSRPARHLFLVPWRNYTLVGVWHVVHEKGPDEVTLTEEELRTFIEEISGSCPSLDISVDDVSMWNAGLVPFGDNHLGAVHLSYGKRSRIIDHQKENNIEGLVTLIGIRYTMARGDAAAAVDLISAKLGRRAGRAPTDTIPVHGGRIDHVEGLVGECIKEQAGRLPADVARALVRNYGSEYRNVLRYTEQDTTLAQTLGDSTVIKAEVLHAIRNEMAIRLADVVFRRTDLGTGGNPGDEALRSCARLMSKELTWTDVQTERELQSVRERFPAFRTQDRLTGNEVAL